MGDLSSESSDKTVTKKNDTPRLAQFAIRLSLFFDLTTTHERAIVQYMESRKLGFPHRCLNCELRQTCKHHAVMSERINAIVNV